MRLLRRASPRIGLYSWVRKAMKARSAPSDSRPCDSSQVPIPITTSAPSSSITFTSGLNSAFTRVEASSASNAPTFCSWKRSTSCCWRL